MIPMLDYLSDKIAVTVIVIAGVLIFRIALGSFLKRKFQEVVGYQLLANLLSGVLAIALAFYLLYVWGIIQPLLELLAAFGMITAVVLFAVKDIWINNFIAGISLIGDRSIDVGSEVEISGKHGKIVGMTLTVTKIETSDGLLLVVPNRKFREDIVTVIDAGKKRKR